MCLPAIGLIAGLAGAGLSAVGSIYAGQVNSANYKAEERALKIDARNQRAIGGYNAQRQEDKNERLTGQQVTAAAASGVDLTGTPLDVVVDSRKEGNLDVQAIRWGAAQRANNSLYAAKVAGNNASTAKTAGNIGAIAPFLTGVQTSFG